tara:strand:- start:10748 stop:11698 length:951 start_codon:yes stop_codon:yes gene_type:complete
MRSKAFFVNGGYGRVVSSIPAFELYAKESNDDDFIIVCEGGTDAFKGHPDLDHRAYDNWHKNLFQEKLKDRDIISPEPYRIWEYYNQKASLAQGYDIAINNKGLRELDKPRMFLSKEEMLTGRQIINQVKDRLKKDKVIIIQPFGRAIQHVDGSFVDNTGRSIEFKDLKSLIRKLQENDFAVITMAEMGFDFSKDKFKEDVAMPEQVALRNWTAAIKYANHFLGCDSVGQHLAYMVDTPSTVVLGPTFPINVSYPNCDYFNIVDLGMTDRVYDPIRIMPDETTSRHNEHLMTMSPEIVDYVIDRVLGKPEPKEDDE